MRSSSAARVGGSSTGTLRPAATQLSASQPPPPPDALPMPTRLPAGSRSRTIENAAARSLISSRSKGSMMPGRPRRRPLEAARVADGLEVEQEHIARALVEQVLDDLEGLQARLVAGGDDVA